MLCKITLNISPIFCPNSWAIFNKHIDTSHGSSMIPRQKHKILNITRCMELNSRQHSGKIAVQNCLSHNTKNLCTSPTKNMEVVQRYLVHGGEHTSFYTIIVQEQAKYHRLVGVIQSSLREYDCATISSSSSFHTDLLIYLQTLLWIH